MTGPIRYSGGGRALGYGGVSEGEASAAYRTLTQHRVVDEYAATGLPPVPDRRLDARMPPANGGRIVFGTLVPWDAKTTVTETDGAIRDEWFTRASVLMPAHDRVPLVVGDHAVKGGSRVGWVRALINMPHALNFAADVDDGEDGDVFLTFLAESPRDPQLSIAFRPIPGRFTDYPVMEPYYPRPGRAYAAVELVDVAVVGKGQYGDAATLWGRGDEDSVNSMLAAARLSK